MLRKSIARESAEHPAAACQEPSAWPALAITHLSQCKTRPHQRDVRRPVAHDAMVVRADVEPADIIAPYNEDVRFLLFLLCHCFWLLSVSKLFVFRFVESFELRRDLLIRVEGRVSRGDTSYQLQRVVFTRHSTLFPRPSLLPHRSNRRR